MRSMTGFGSSTVEIKAGRFVIELKTVNHRFLEIRSRLPHELNAIEHLLEARVRSRLQRGYCTLHLYFEYIDHCADHLQTQRLQQHILSLRHVSQETGLSLESLMPILAGIPDLLHNTIPSDETTQDAVIQICDEAIQQVLWMRDNEGRAMQSSIAQSIDRLSALATHIESISDHHSSSLMSRYKERIHQLLSTPAHDSNENRIEIEAALLVDRLDISEEILRLKSHISQLKGQLEMTTPVGRRMEFLLQELGREANTIGGKTNLTEVTHFVVDLKSELEKIRELVQNIE
jgi:uncharacterized protein (TIGR00255 family)